jgi:hypothetical protein
MAVTEVVWVDGLLRGREYEMPVSGTLMRPLAGLEGTLIPDPFARAPTIQSATARRHAPPESHLISTTLVTADGKGELSRCR